MAKVTESGSRRPWTWSVIAFGVILPFSSQAADDLEYRVKAAFLLNFTKFVEWPETAFGNPDSPLAICILGIDPFGSALTQIVQGEVANGRNVTVQRITSVPSPKSCQVLFISKSEKDLPKLLPALGPGVLTVGEGDSFVHNGGIIGFVIEDRRVRFEINQSAAESAALKLSSKLLSVAKAVEK